MLGPITSTDFLGSAKMFNQTFHNVGTVVNVAGDFTLNQNSSKEDLVTALKMVLEQAQQDPVLKSAGAETATAAEAAIQEALEEAQAEGGSKTTLVDKLNQASGVLAGAQKTANTGWELAKTVTSIAGWAAAFLA